MKNIIQKMVELQELNDRYGHISCFDAEEEYNQMEDLAEEIYSDVDRLARQHKDGYGVPLFSTESLREALDNIAYEIHAGNINEDAELHIYTQDEFLEHYVLQGFDESQTEVFDSLFYFMNVDDRVKWLDINHIDGNCMYTNRMIDFVIVINE